MIAGGIDLGGTKIEAQKFDDTWQVVDRRRVATPASYHELLDALADQVHWLRSKQEHLPVGIAAAGMMNPASGNWVAANLAAHEKPFVADIAEMVNDRVHWLNDCRAFTQAEAVFGASSANGTVLGLLLGTGIGGAVATNGDLLNDGMGQSGEFGHMPIAANVIEKHRLDLVTCGCGRVGCYETYGAGPGMSRIAKKIAGHAISAEDITANLGDAQMDRIFDIWCDVNAHLIYALCCVVDPKVVILGGGLSKIPGLIPALEAKLRPISWEGFALPSFQLAGRGETAAALGAAYAAWKAAQDG